MKIYTRKGDKGRTKLLGRKSVSKASPRIDAYGEVDELNTALGIAASQIEDVSVKSLIQKLQDDLFVLCADLADPNLETDTHRIGAHQVEALEKRCDEFEAKLPPLKKFILPGGSIAGARLHFTRAVARRAERRVVGLAEEESINPEAIRYLNRLSDLLFLMARWMNVQAGVSESHPNPD